MAPKSLLEHNPHLRNAQEYQRALRASVLSSIAIEGVKKAAERALSPTPSKQKNKARQPALSAGFIALSRMAMQR
jgi:hypothetical protein